MNNISISDGRLSIVAPGPGVELFGNYYSPGVTVGGEFQIDNLTGQMLVSITDEGVLAYGGMSKIDFPGFKLTSSDGTKGPEASKYIAQNTGDAAGIVTINEASFAACIGKAVDDKVALEIKGTYADQPIDSSFDINLKSPDALIKDRCSVNKLKPYRSY